MENIFDIVAKQLQAEFEEHDTLEALEKINPKVTQKYNENNTVIFKQPIKMDSAEKLMGYIQDTHLTYSEYREQLFSYCNIVLAVGESPTEMIIYGMKCLAHLEDHTYVNALVDILKHLYERDRYFKKAYANILENWSWNECITLTLRSINDIHLTGYEEVIYKIFSTQDALQQQAALTLVTLGEEQYFNNIIKRLVSEDKYSQKQLNNLRKTLIAIARSSNTGVLYLYNTYMNNMSLLPEVQNCLVASIRNNFNEYIIEEIQRVLYDPFQDRTVHNRILNLLLKCNRNERVIQFVKNLKDLPYLNKEHLNLAFGLNDISAQKEIARNQNLSEKLRKEALYTLANVTDAEVDEILEEVSQDSDVMNIIVASVRVERGQMNQIIILFKYLMSTNMPKEVVSEASYQIKRLCGRLGNELNDVLFNVAETIFKQEVTEENLIQIINFLDIYCYGKTTEKIATLLLDYLKVVKHPEIIKKLYAFFSKNVTVLPSDLQKQIKLVVVEGTKQEREIAREAMKCLKNINIGNDEIPIFIKEGNV